MSSFRPCSGRIAHALRLAALLAGVIGVSHGDEPPATFSRTISTATESVNVDFALHPIRGEHFEVLVQEPGGGLVSQTPPAARTYLGQVSGHPGAIASGLLKEDGTLLCRISFESGVEWSSTGGTASIRGTTNWSPSWPTTSVGTGGAGSLVRAAEVGVDSTHRQFLACGATVQATVEMAEFSVLSSNLIYLRDAAILHKLGKVVVRTDAASDPYEPLGSSTNPLLLKLREIWTAPSEIGSSHDLALVARPGAGGGLAWVGAVGTGNHYSANGTDSNGDFTVIWRHEAGHNWSSNHFEGGGKPEGPTVLSDNTLSRFSSPELAKVIEYRNTRLAILDDIGSYSAPLPPRANGDRAVIENSSPITIDVLKNDSDSNGDVVSILSFDATSTAGATIVRSIGTGPGGRDQLVYHPASGTTVLEDSFSYRISDGTGRTGTGYVVLRPTSLAYQATDRWPLDDWAGNAFFNTENLVRPQFPAWYHAVTTGETGASPATSKGVYFDGGVDSIIWLSGLGYNTATFTFTAWIKRDGQQLSEATIFKSTTGGPTLLGMGANHELRYQWNGVGAASPTLILPDNEWCLVAMAASPEGMTLHLRTPSGLSSATHPGALAADDFNSGNIMGEAFKGWLDDIRTYKQVLPATAIESLYQQAMHPPAIEIVSPLAGSQIPPLDVELTAEITTGGESVKKVEFFETQSFGSVTSFPYTVRVPAMDEGMHEIVARAEYGDWGYSISAAPISFRALPPPTPVITVTTEGVPSRSGPRPAYFLITRSHPLGLTPVPYTLGGTAVQGVDYTIASGPTIYISNGQSTAAFEVMPVAGPPSAEPKTITLTLGSSSAFVAGSPNTATMTIGDHFSSVTNGEWDVGSTWTSGTAAPVTGAQNTGNDYVVRHVVTSNDPATNNQAMIAKSLRLESGAILDLARTHATTLQNASYNLPNITLEDGARIRFRAGVGSVMHNVAAGISTAGNTTLVINGGSYSHKANLTGAISGSGTIAVLSDSQGNAVTADLRQISVNSANNSFNGDWTITHTGGGDENAGLRAGAAGALGTGRITVGARAHLINDVAGGINSLKGVTMTGDSSKLLVNQPWNQPDATLALNAGTAEVKLGAFASSIGNLSGGAGMISGNSTSTVLTIKQVTDGSFGGRFVSPLRV